MSTEEDKIKHSKRLQKEENAIHKQQAIALQHGIDKKLVEDEPHRFAKHHAMDEHIPHKINKQLTAQEQRMYQDLETQRDTHSNGLPPTDD
jgi:hypothetical protein